MPWVDLSQAAFTLGVSERTIRNWIKSGKLRARSTNGRREVEIPDPDAEDADRIYADDEEPEGGTSMDTQKRLEVALLECGRVKGTLASQERIMENLSSNIAELNAKLQRSHGVIWQRTLAAVVVAFLGVGAYLLSSASHQQTLSDERNRQLQEREKLKDDQQAVVMEMTRTQADAIAALNKKMEEQRRQAEEERRALEARLKEEYRKELEARREDMQRLLDRAEGRVETLQEELDKLKTEKLKAEATLESERKDRQRLEIKIAELERKAAVYEAQVKELEKTRRELESNEIKLRRKIMGETSESE